MDQIPAIQDKGKIERLHSMTCDQISDLLIKFQDESYELGVNQGRRESSQVWSVLENLVIGMQNTTWSSWQNTAHFAEALREAEALLSGKEST